MNTTRPAAGAAAPELLAYATCPLCRTTATRTNDAGADWLCARCGQRWTATRLASVTAYAAWVAERQLVPGR